jgi:hypothetical protein
MFADCDGENDTRVRCVKEAVHHRRIAWDSAYEISAAASRVCRTLWAN